MGCNPPRNYLRAPVGVGLSLPDIPTNPNDWQGIQRILTQLRDSMGGNPENQTVPGAVQNFAVENRPSGNLLTWDRGPHEDFYVLYRGDSNDFTKARSIGYVAAGNGFAAQWYDACGQNQDGESIYYWIHAWNSGGYGPMSLTVGVAQPCQCDSDSCESCESCDSSAGCTDCDSFTDSLTTGSSGLGLGDDWICGIFIPTNTAMETNRSYNRASGAAFSASSASQTNGTAYVCIPACAVSSIRSSQYVEAIYASNNSAQGTAVLVGGIVALSAVQASHWRAYSLSWIPTSTTPDFWQLTRHQDATTATGIASGSPGSLVAGDVVGLSVEVQPTKNVIRVWINNVMVSSTDDSNSARPTFGNPGIACTAWVSGSSPGTKTLLFTDFFCRTGTR